VLIAFVLLLGPTEWSRALRQGLRSTVLRPFVGIREWVATRRSDREDLRVVRAQRDSLAAVVAAQAVLREENARLRALLGLAARAGPHFRVTHMLSLGTDAAEGTFLLGLGATDGVAVGSPVFTVGGLVGVVRDVQRNGSQAIDWTHPEFRVSAMTADGQVYGIVEPRRGSFREEDLLILTGAPFHSDVQPGTRIVTSGRGTVFPRGIPIGDVVSIQDADTGWRKSYLVKPSVRPESALQVLVGLTASGGLDLSELWEVSAAGAAGQGAARGPQFPWKD
jgi:rod shape-determining protein MreC